MQHRTPQSRVPRPAHIQPLEGRRLMSVVPAMELPMPFAPPGDVMIPAGPMPWGFDPRVAMERVAPAVQVEAATAAPETVASLAPSVSSPVAAPASAPATPLATDLLSAGGSSTVTTTAAPAIAPVADWAQPAAFATGGIALAATPVAVPAVSTALGEVVPTVDRTPFAADAVTPALAPANLAAAMGPESDAPAPVDTSAVALGVSMLGAPASVAAPSFGETVIASAGASHPLAIALAAAGAAAALWVSTESARDRRREALCRTVADAVRDRQLVALGLFRA